MLTAKLFAYSPKEVDKLHELLTRIIHNPIGNHCEEICSNCEKCEIKHVCTDICALRDFISDEKILGYPHTRNINGE